MHLTLPGMVTMTWVYVLQAAHELVEGRKKWISGVWVPLVLAIILEPHHYPMQDFEYGSVDRDCETVAGSIAISGRIKKTKERYGISMVASIPRPH